MLLRLQRKNTEMEQLAAGVALPDVPNELVLAEDAVAAVQKEKQDADTYSRFLQENFNRLGLVRPDGSAIPTGDVKALAAAMQDCERLEHARTTALRNLADQRRAYGELAERHIAPGVAAIVDKMLDQLDQLENLLSLVVDVQAEARARQILVRARPLPHPVNGLADAIRSIRTSLRSRS